MRCLKFENQGNPVNQRESHRGRKRIFGKSTEVARGRTSVKVKMDIFRFNSKGK